MRNSKTKNMLKTMALTGVLLFGFSALSACLPSGSVLSPVVHAQSEDVDKPVLTDTCTAAEKNAGNCKVNVDSAVGCETRKENGCDFMSSFIKPAIVFLSAGVGLVVIIMITIAGITYSSAGGDANKVSSAKKMITNAILALVTYVFLFAILQFLIPGGLI